MKTLTSALLVVSLLLGEAAANRPNNRHHPTLPINVINLDKDTTRWETLVQDLTVKGVQFASIHRLSAVYGKTLPKSELLARTTRKARLWCTPGMIGCYLSHVKFWTKVMADPHPYQMVLEDDAVVVDEGFEARAQQMVEELQSNPDACDQWDVLLLGAFSCVHPERKYGMYRAQAWLLGDGRKQRRVSKHLQVPHRPLGTHAYILSKRGAAKLMQRASKATWHVDCVMWGLPELNLYVCDPMLVFQDTSSPSTVGAVTKGIETWLPKWKLDDYTHASFEWVWNEPFFNIPGTKVAMSIGRYIALFFGGILAALLLVGKIPGWVLPTHITLCIGFAVTFTRIMKRPVALSQVEDAVEATGVSADVVPPPPPPASSVEKDRIQPAGSSEEPAAAA